MYHTLNIVLKTYIYIIEIPLHFLKNIQQQSADLKVSYVGSKSIILVGLD